MTMAQLISQELGSLLEMATFRTLETLTCSTEDAVKNQHHECSNNHHQSKSLPHMLEQLNP